MANLKHTESTREKIARIERKRRAIEQDKREFGFYPDLDDDEIRAIMSAKVERTLKRLAIEQINLHL